MLCEVIMTFKEGFAAIDQVKASSQKLSETISRLERLENNLSELHKAYEKLNSQVDESKAALRTVTDVSKALSMQQSEYINLAKDLPVMVEGILAAAEAEFSTRANKLAGAIESLPTMVEAVIEKKLSDLISQHEIRISDRVRDELKDTRATLREAFENGAARHEARLSDAKRDIIAEMPRGMFGRRGQS
jgi:DNA repair exonuclease SbcCD ATPase subunit